MFKFKVSGTALNKAVAMELVAGSMNEAINRFMNGVRITKVKATDKPAENGLKLHDLTFVVGDKEYTTQLQSNDVFSIINMAPTSRIAVTGVEELGPVEPTAPVGPA